MAALEADLGLPARKLPGRARPSLGAVWEDRGQQEEAEEAAAKPAFPRNPSAGDGQKRAEGTAKRKAQWWKSGGGGNRAPWSGEWRRAGVAPLPPAFLARSLLPGGRFKVSAWPPPGLSGSLASQPGCRGEGKARGAEGAGEGGYAELSLPCRNGGAWLAHSLSASLLCGRTALRFGSETEEGKARREESVGALAPRREEVC